MCATIAETLYRGAVEVFMADQFDHELQQHRFAVAAITNADHKLLEAGVRNQTESHPLTHELDFLLTVVVITKHIDQEFLERRRFGVCSSQSTGRPETQTHHRIVRDKLVMVMSERHHSSKQTKLWFDLNSRRDDTKSPSLNP